MIRLLPKIYYDLSIANENPIPVIIPDVLTRIKLNMSATDKKKMLSSYFMIDGDTPEIVSHKLYGTMDYYWVIMYINDRFDYIADFPIKYETVESFCQKKYGVDQVYEIHHYEDGLGNIVDEYYFDWRNSGGKQPAGVFAEQPIWKTYHHDSEIQSEWTQLKTLRGIAITNFEYENQVNESKRHIQVIKTQYIGDFIQQYEKKIKELA